MKRIVATLMLCLSFIMLFAQGMTRVSTFIPEVDLPGDTIASSLYQQPAMRIPGSYGFGLWDLHEGLNVGISASVSAAFGKHAPKGVGISENVSLMYAHNINERLSLVFGANMFNTDWDGYSMRAASITALLNYRITSHLEAYVYGNKNIIGSSTIDGCPWMYNPYYGGFANACFGYSPWGIGPYGYGSFGYGPYGYWRDSVGAGLRYTFNKNFAVEVQVNIPVGNQDPVFSNKKLMPTTKSVEEHWQHP